MRETADDMATAAEPSPQDPSAWLPSPSPAPASAVNTAVLTPPADTSARWLTVAAEGTSPSAAEPAKAAGERWRVDSAEELSLSPQQRLAVTAYCREICGTEGARAATEEAVRIAAAASDPPGGSEQRDTELLRAARVAAATQLTERPTGAGWKSRFADALAAEHEVSCRRVPLLLAERANGKLRGAEAAELDEHLAHCLRCQAAEVRAGRAERAFLAALSGVGLSELAPDEVREQEPDERAAAWIAPATGAGAATSEWQATTTVPAARPAPAPRRRRRGAAFAGRRRVLAGAAGVLLLAAAGIAIAESGNGTSTSSTTPPVAATPPSSAPANRAHTRAHAKGAKPHRRAAANKPHKVAKKPVAVASAPVTSAASSTPVAVSTPPPATVVVRPTAPTPSSPTASTQPTVSISPTNLGSAPGPTQGVGGGKH